MFHGCGKVLLLWKSFIVMEKIIIVRMLYEKNPVAFRSVLPEIISNFFLVEVVEGTLYFIKNFEEKKRPVVKTDLFMFLKIMIIQGKLHQLR